MKSNSLPAGLVSTLFKWLYYDEAYSMHFYAGFMTVTQDPQMLAIYPEIGWSVADNKEVESVSKKALSHWGLCMGLKKTCWLSHCNTVVCVV